MLVSFLCITAGFYWLIRESNWLRVRLESYESLKDYDKRILAGMVETDEQWLKRWWEESGSAPAHGITRKREPIDWDELEKRQQGLGIYSRSLEAQYYVERG